MADKVTFQKQWLEAIINDDNLDLSEQELAYIVYAAIKYGLYGEKMNIGKVFGNEFKMLNLTLPNIYSQIDNIANYKERKSEKNTKYDSEAIYELRMKGFTGKQICEALGYSVEVERNLSTTPGWVRARNDMKDLKIDNTDKNTDGIQESVKVSVTPSNFTDTEYRSVQNSVKSVQNDTDSVQKSVKKSVSNFDF